jgi:hypothetical protein
MDSIDEFGLSRGEADAALAEIREAVAPWAELAARHGVTSAELERFESVLTRL